MTESYDFDDTVRDAATVACLCDRDRALHVLLLRRAPGHVFGPGAHVFPGGAIDAVDYALAAALAPGTDAAERQPPYLVARLAAIRETFEEAGVLIAVTGATPSNTQLDALRNELAAHERAWDDTVAELDCQLSPGALIDCGSRTTPPGWPRRFATRFFVVACSPELEPRCDHSEMDAAAWWRPAAALAAARDDTISLMKPTRIALERLAAFTTTRQAINALSPAAGFWP